jgi:hypothetical protein
MLPSVSTHDGGKMKAIKWGIMTFLLGITTGVMGAYLPSGLNGVVVVIVSGLYAAFGAFAISEFWEAKT